MGFSNKTSDVCLMEFLGTFFLVFGVHGVRWLPYQTSMSAGGLLTLITMFGKLSAAQFNGAVTLLLYSLEPNKSSQNKWKYFSFFISQIAGYKQLSS